MQRRKRFLIDKRYQLYYPITWIVMVALALVNFLIVHMLVVAAGRPDGTELVAVAAIFAKSTSAIIMLTSVWMGFASILHSHRIAGAMFNINRTLQRVLEGDLDVKVRLRKEDFSTDVAEKINELIARLRELRNRVYEQQQQQGQSQKQEVHDAEAVSIEPE